MAEPIEASEHRATDGASAALADPVAPSTGPVSGESAGLDPRVRLRWLLPAIASVVALGVAAPGGLALLAFLGVVIAVHEAGHLVVARRAGMQPTEFFWGFGPEVASIEVRGCRYGVRALFLGGYVRLEGMTPSSEVPEGFDESGTYRAASHRGRLATILAGPGVNLVSAVVAFTAAGLVDGRTPLGAVGSAFRQVWLVIDATAWSLWTLGANLGTYVQAVVDPAGGAEAPVRFLSPVAQAQTSELALSLGPAVALQWFGILSAAIGIINLVPLPPLDGGHAVVAGVEGALRRLRGDRSVTLDAARLTPVAWVTVVALVVLSVSALVLDLRDLA
ncbi:MAG: site-2 protease family protein [Actinomycetota bacterium]